MLDQLQELGRGAVRRRGAAELPLHGAGRTVYPQHLRAAAQKQPYPAVVAPPEHVSLVPRVPGEL